MVHTTASYLVFGMGRCGGLNRERRSARRVRLTERGQASLAIFLRDLECIEGVTYAHAEIGDKFPNVVEQALLQALLQALVENFLAYPAHL